MVKHCQEFIFTKKCENNECELLHEDNICIFYWKNNNCKFKDNCKFIHTKNPDNKHVKQKNKNFRKSRNTVDFKPLTKDTDLKIVLSLSSNDLDKKMI